MISGYRIQVERKLLSIYRLRDGRTHQYLRLEMLRLHGTAWGVFEMSLHDGLQRCFVSTCVKDWVWRSSGFDVGMDMAWRMRVVKLEMG